MRLISVVAAVAMLAGSLDVRADIVNDTFSGSFDLPPGAPTTPTITFTGGEGASIPWLFDLQFTDSQIILTMLSNGDIAQSFARLDVTDLSEDPGFTSLVVDPTSTFIGPVASFTSDTLSIDLANAGYYTGQQTIFNFQDAATETTLTPEPSSFALLGTGLLGIAGVVRKRFA